MLAPSIPAGRNRHHSVMSPFRRTTDVYMIGKPGEIKVTYMKDGSKFVTKIGEDGRAVMERYYTNHYKPHAHSSPHDHQIRCDAPRYGIPNFVKPHINYWPNDYPDGAPEFKTLRRDTMYTHCNFGRMEDEDRFKTISEFKECMVRGGEVEFLWKGIHYSITHYNGNISISHSCRQDTEMLRKLLMRLWNTWLERTDFVM